MPKWIFFTLSAARRPTDTIHRPLALRPGLATGLPLSRIKEVTGLQTSEALPVRQAHSKCDSGRKTSVPGPVSRLPRLADASASRLSNKTYVKSAGCQMREFRQSRAIPLFPTALRWNMPVIRPLGLYSRRSSTGTQFPLVENRGFTSNPHFPPTQPSGDARLTLTRSASEGNLLPSTRSSFGLGCRW
jgi:hypothetical protein